MSTIIVDIQELTCLDDAQSTVYWQYILIMAWLMTIEVLKLKKVVSRHNFCTTDDNDDGYKKYQVYLLWMLIV